MTRSPSLFSQSLADPASSVSEVGDEFQFVTVAAMGFHGFSNAPALLIHVLWPYHLRDTANSGDSAHSQDRGFCYCGCRSPALGPELCRRHGAWSQFQYEVILCRGWKSTKRGIFSSHCVSELSVLSCDL